MGENILLLYRKLGLIAMLNCHSHRRFDMLFSEVVWSSEGQSRQANQAD